MHNNLLIVNASAESRALVALDKATGDQVWSHSYPAELNPNLYDGGPGSTPTVHKDFVFSLSVDGRLIGSMKRSAPAHDFRTNVAQAGQASAWQPSDRERDLARQAAVATGCLFCGVDLMYNAAGEPYILEVNAVPGWRALQKVSSVDVPEAVVCFLEQQVAGGRS